MSYSTQEVLVLSPQEEKELQLREHDMLDGGFLTHEEVFTHVHTPVSQNFSEISPESKKKDTIAR